MARGGGSSALGGAVARPREDRQKDPAAAGSGIRLQGVDRHAGDQPTGGKFVLHAKALHGNPFDGHTLGPVVAELEQMTGVETRRIHVDRGYRGHNHRHKFRAWITGQVRRVTRPIRREMKRRAAVEPVIGHLKAEHAWAAITSRAATAIVPTPCWPPPATTSPSCCAG
jgi:hypothetical protein